MPFQPTAEPTGLRQICAGTFNKVPPQKGSVTYLPDKFEDGLYTYVDPSDHTKDTADTNKAGEWDFGGKAVFLMEIRAAVGANNIQADVADAGGAPLASVLAATSGNNTRNVFDPPIPVLPGERLRVSSAGGSGSITVYVVKGDRSW
jgi:hypothetical protein